MIGRVYIDPGDRLSGRRDPPMTRHEPARRAGPDRSILVDNGHQRVQRHDKTGTDPGSLFSNVGPRRG